jgi:hypothetical protein
MQVEPPRSAEVFISHARDDPARDAAHAEVEKWLASGLGGLWKGWRPAPAGLRLALWVQTAEVDGRRTITGLLVLGESVTASDLRKLPIGAIENVVNLGLDQPPAELGDELDALPPLVRDGAMRPEDWSKLVAAHYTAWARRGPNPGARISQRWGVNRQTVAAWVREARLRGFLPPARRSKASGRGA